MKNKSISAVAVLFASFFIFVSAAPQNAGANPLELPGDQFKNDERLETNSNPRDGFTDQIIIKFKDNYIGKLSPQSIAMVDKLSAKAGVNLKFQRNMSGDASVYSLPITHQWIR